MVTTLKNKYFLAHIVTFFIGMIITLYLPKTLSIEQYSKYAILSVCITFFIPICSLGLVSYIVRYYKQREKEFDLGSNSKAIYSIGLMLTLFSVGSYSYIFDLGVYEFFVLYASVSLLALVSISSAYYRAKGDASAYFSLVATQKITHLIIFLIITYIYESTAILYFLSGSLSCLIVLALTGYNCFPPKDNRMISLDTIKSSVTFCIPIAIANISVTIIPVIERNLISSLYDTMTLAQFVFNYELISKFTAVSLLIIKISVWPYVACGERRLELIRYKEVLKKSALALSILLPIAMIFVYFAYNFIVIKALNMESYANINIFYLFVLSSVFLVYNYIINIGSMILDKTHIITIKTINIIILHVVGIYALSEFFGIYGVVISMMFAQFAGVIYSFHKNRRIINLEMVRE